MKKELYGSITEKPIYKVDLYQVIGKSYMFSNYVCDVDSLGKILVSVSNENKNHYRDNAGECIEVIEGFSVPLIDCPKSSRYEWWDNEHVTEFYFPYEYDYWDKYRSFIVHSSDINESNLATLEDLKEYEPQNELWYESLKEIQEKGIDFDYELEAIEKIYGKAPENTQKIALRKERKTNFKKNMKRPD